MKRLHEFDALRGIAAVAVVFAHLLNYAPASMGSPYGHWSAPFWSFAANGHFAVLIFFAISGFVLSYPYFIGAKAEKNLKLDVANRLPRLLIPVFITGMLCFVIQMFAISAAGGEQLAPFASPEWIARWNVSGWDTAREIEFLMTRVFFLYSETDTMNVNLWTMPVEFAFSLLVFAVGAVVLRRFDIALLLIIISGASIFSWRADMLEYFLKALAGSVFFLGVLVAYQVEGVRSVVGRRWWMPSVLMIGGLLVSSVLTRHDMHYLLANALGLMSIFWFFIGFASAPQLREKLDHPFFGFLGEVSFALYLVHGSILYAVFQIIAAQGDYGMGQFALGVAISLVLSFSLSFVIARYVEMPLVGKVRRTIGSLIHDTKAA
jgi:peptidoglycan/LPS O-acetylase OafA/YrhL